MNVQKCLIGKELNMIGLLKVQNMKRYREKSVVNLKKMITVILLEFIITLNLILMLYFIITMKFLRQNNLMKIL